MEHMVDVVLDGQTIAFAVNHDDIYGDTLQYQVSELELLTRAMNVTNTSTVYLDLGANIGLTSRLAINRGFEVFAFEPSPHARKLLKQNAIGATIVPLGVGDKLEKSKITDSPSLFGNSVGEHGVDSIEMTTLDYWVSQANITKPISIVKIDVEGYEPKVLEGAHQTLRQSNPAPLVVMEVNLFGLDTVGRVSTMAFLERIRLEWGGYSHLIDGNLEVVKNYEQSRVLVYRLCNSGKCWTDIAFGRGYDQL